MGKKARDARRNGSAAVNPLMQRLADAGQDIPKNSTLEDRVSYLEALLRNQVQRVKQEFAMLPEPDPNLQEKMALMRMVDFWSEKANTLVDMIMRNAQQLEHEEPSGSKGSTGPVVTDTGNELNSQDVDLDRPMHPVTMMDRSPVTDESDKE